MLSMSRVGFLAMHGGCSLGGITAQRVHLGCCPCPYSIFYSNRMLGLVIRHPCADMSLWSATGKPICGSRFCTHFRYFGGALQLYLCGLPLHHLGCGLVFFHHSESFVSSAYEENFISGIEHISVEILGTDRVGESTQPWGTG